MQHTLPSQIVLIPWACCNALRYASHPITTQGPADSAGERSIFSRASRKPFGANDPTLTPNGLAAVGNQLEGWEWGG